MISAETLRRAKSIPSALDHVADPAQRGQYDAHLLRVIRQIFRTDGLQAFGSTRWDAAVHEAGHVVVYALTADGGQWAMPHRTKVWREPNELSMDFWCGYTAVAPGSPPINLDARTAPVKDLIVYALRNLAGVVAENLFAPEQFKQGSSLDELILAGGIATALAARGFFESPEVGLAYLFKMVFGMLDANRLVHQRIAETLNHQRRLDPPDLRRLLQNLIKAAP